MNRIIQFLQESRQEFKHVNWPTRQEAFRLTSIVVGISLVLAIFLGAFDILFSRGIAYFVEQVVLK